MSDAGIRAICSVVVLVLGMGLAGERALTQEAPQEEADQEEQAAASPPPAARVLVRSRLPALLHPWPRRHRLRLERLAAGVPGLRRGRPRESRAQGTPVWDLERVEVLRGPQGSLSGRNFTDEEIVQNGIDCNNLTCMMNEPRIVGVELVSRF